VDWAQILQQRVVRDLLPDDREEDLAFVAVVPGAAPVAKAEGGGDSDVGAVEQGGVQTDVEVAQVVVSVVGGELDVEAGQYRGRGQDRDVHGDVTSGLSRPGAGEASERDAVAFNLHCPSPSSDAGGDADVDGRATAA